MIADSNNSVICSGLILKNFVSEAGGAIYSKASFNKISITNTTFNNFISE